MNNVKDFERLLLSFTGSKEDVYIDKKTKKFTIDTGQKYIEGKLIINKEKELYCQSEGSGYPTSYKNWVFDNLADLHLLARSLKKHFTLSEHIIPSIGIYQPPVDTDPNGTKKPVNDVVKHLKCCIEKMNDIETNLIYLTSEAGEGKTVVMEKLAYEQACDYLTHKTSWLFVPISLQGRPLLRLDEVIVGALTNTFRFRNYFYETFIELVKSGKIVLGLDGFEEMAIVRSEDEVISSLATLLSELDSEGKMIFSVRTAYYNYNNLNSQSTLFNSIRNSEVTFSELQLKKWEKKQFMDLLKTYAIDHKEVENIYNTLSNKLGNSHSLLTRPVLIDRLANTYFEDISKGIEVNEINSSITNLLSDEGDTDNIFSHFILYLIKREAESKWLSKSKPVRPILSQDQHCELLEEIAGEMWASSVQVLNFDTLTTITEISIEDMSINHEYKKQCKERIIHHVFIKQQEENLYSFCHDDFRLYFLGRKIYHEISKQKNQNTRNILSRDNLPEFAVTQFTQMALLANNIDTCVRHLLEISHTVSRSSYISQNLSYLILRLRSKMKSPEDSITLSNLYVNRNSLNISGLINVKFEKCTIENICLDSSNFSHLDFLESDISSIVINLSTPFKEIHFDNYSIPQKLQAYSDKNAISDENAIYNPISIRNYLKKAKIYIDSDINQDDNKEIIEDEIVRKFFTIVHSFLRATSIKKEIVLIKAGEKKSDFIKVHIPQLIKKNIFIENKGQGNVIKYKLGVPLSKLEAARKECDGSFDDFLNKIYE